MTPSALERLTARYGEESQNDPIVLYLVRDYRRLLDASVSAVAFLDALVGDLEGGRPADVEAAREALGELADEVVLSLPTP